MKKLLFFLFVFLTATMSSWAVIETYVGTPVSVSCSLYDVPVTVKNFDDVGAISLVLQYDNTKLVYQSVTLHSFLTGALTGNPTGEFRLSWNGPEIDLGDNAVLFTVRFKLQPTVSDITTLLKWSILSGDCEYASYAGIVYPSSFFDGSIIVPVRPITNLTNGYKFCTIQEAIDDPATVALDIITVPPGNYNQDEANGWDPVTGGSGSSDFNIFVNKSVTIRGVTALGAEITSASSVAAYIIPMRNTPSGNLPPFLYRQTMLPSVVLM